MSSFSQQALIIEQLQSENKALKQKIKEQETSLDLISRFPHENPTPIIRLSSSFELIFYNTAALPLLQTLEKPNNRKLFEILQNDTHRATTENSPKTQELVIGNDFYEIKYIPFADRKYTNIYFTNQTKLRLAQLKLTKSESKYRKLIESATDIIYRASPEGFFTYANPVAIRTVGLGEHEIIGKHFTELIRFDYKKLAIKFYERQFQERRQTSYFEFPILCQNDEVRWLGQHVQLFEDNGHIIEFAAVARDITERKRTEVKLQKSEKKHKAVIASKNLGLIEFDDELKITKIHTQFTKLTNFEETELDGYSIVDVLIPEEWQHKFIELVENRINNDSYSEEIPIRTKNDELLWTLLSVTALYDNDMNIIGSMAIILNINERKKAEKQLIDARQKAEESSLAKEKFLANMSHEIRTPMNAIIGMSTLLMKHELPAKLQDYTRAIYQSSSNLLVLINDILDFSKIEAGKLEIEHVNFDLLECINTSFDSVRHSAQEKQLNLVCEVEKNIPKHLLGDTVRLGQIIINLLGNAVKFTHKGSVSLKVELLNQTSKKVRLKFQISDTGMGIPEDKQATIFNSFSQVDDSTTRKFGGTGLGLSICKQLVELHGGSLKLKSKVNEGTTFFFELVFPKTEAYKATENTTQSFNTEPLKQLKILMAEDHEVNQFLAKSIFEDAGIPLDICSNGQEAVDLHKKLVYDVILMDIQMPVMGGQDATRVIREELSSQVPIIALTANAIKGDHEKYLEYGMNGYVSKPYEPINLFEKILEMINPDHKPQQPSHTDMSKLNYEEKALFSLDQLNKISNGNNTFIQKILNSFLEHTPAIVDNLEASLNAKEWQRSSELIHRLKATYITLEVKELLDIMGDVELRWQSMTPADLESNISHIIVTSRKLFSQLTEKLGVLTLK